MGYTWTTRSSMVLPLGALLSRTNHCVRTQATSKVTPLHSSVLDWRSGELEDDVIFSRFYVVRRFNYTSGAYSATQERGLFTIANQRCDPWNDAYVSPDFFVFSGPCYCPTPVGGRSHLGTVYMHSW